MDSPGTRISRLEDVIHAIKQYSNDGEIDLTNETVNWHEFEGLPKSVQTPHPPIMIGGGSKRVLTLAGQTADIVSFNFNNRQGIIGPDGVQTSTESETLKKLSWIKAGAGDRFSEIELEIGAYFTFVTDQPDPVVAMFAQNFGLPEDEMRKHPHALFGDVPTICEELERRREATEFPTSLWARTILTALHPLLSDLADSNPQFRLHAEPQPHENNQPIQQGI